MKLKLLVGVALWISICFCFGSIAYAQQAQQSEETVTVPKSMLSKDQLADLAAKNMADRVKQYGSWVGIGHEVGVAVNEGLQAVSSQANTFAQTPVGKWTIFIIIFKVIGQQALGVLFAALIIVVGIPLWIWSFRRFLPDRVVRRETLDPVSGKVVTREYEQRKLSEVEGFLVAHYVGLALMFGAAALAVFGPW